jgi:hypothetical protein
VFAVDQTVQRSPDGSEERTIAKTVSLLLTPEQASKLTLAEHLGEISLIPRNPDDEESATAAEYSADDLLAEGERGSREKEQGIDEHAGDSAGTGLLTAVQAVPPKPPFLMEIVEAHDVRVMEFDAETGKPVRDATAASPVGPSVSVPSGDAEDESFSEDTPSAPATDPEQMLDDFPIDFDATN